MIINPDNDLLPVLSKRKQEKNVVSKQDNRIEKSKKWKEEHWILTKIIESSINTIVALIIGGAVGFLGGYLIAKKSPQLPAPQSTSPKTTVQ